MRACARAERACVRACVRIYACMCVSTCTYHTYRVSSDNIVQGPDQDHGLHRGWKARDARAVRLTALESHGHRYNEEGFSRSLSRPKKDPDGENPLSPI